MELGQNPEPRWASMEEHGLQGVMHRLHKSVLTGSELQSEIRSSLELCAFFRERDCIAGQVLNVLTIHLSSHYAYLVFCIMYDA